MGKENQPPSDNSHRPGGYPYYEKVLEPKLVERAEENSTNWRLKEPRSILESPSEATHSFLYAVLRKGETFGEGEGRTFTKKFIIDSNGHLLEEGTAKENLETPDLLACLPQKDSDKIHGIG